MYFNTFLKKCRSRLNFTQQTLVEELYSFNIESFGGLDVPTLSKWERGITQPSALRQAEILKYFQGCFGIALPCLEHLGTEEIEDLICHAGMNNLIVGKNKELVLNFNTSIMQVGNLQITEAKEIPAIDSLIEFVTDMRNDKNPLSTQISNKQLTAWAKEPDNRFHVCRYKEVFVGLLFSIRLKPEVFEAIIQFEKSYNTILAGDFASDDEMGSYLVVGFFALNDNAAALLYLQFYAHIIMNQTNIKEIGATTAHDEGIKILENMNLHFVKKLETEEKEVRSYKTSLNNFFASENFMRIFFSKKSCPEI